MAVPLTPVTLAAMYELLRTMQPFSAWDLPPTSAVKFSVASRDDVFGEYATYSGTDHEIMLSRTSICHLNTALRVMAHEILHLRQAIAKTDTDGEMHNADFKKHAKQIARRFGWDEREF